MWIIRWSLIVIVMLLILGFSLQNQDQRVIIRFGSYTTPEMPVYFALYISFALGVFVFLLISIYNLLQLKGEISRHRKENRKLREELDRLRNLTIEEEVEFTPPEADSIEKEDER
ncbi:LapA family protein [bacterium]|nr:LapA family protein [FCB group bacterium]MBL7190978.1 LapA family protein [bacterium]